MTNKEIADKLREYARLKARQKAITAELVKVLVEDVGLTQEAVITTDSIKFLDGYLVGQGMIEDWRQG